MSRNLGYTKKFIILKKDFSNMTGLNPKGHGKIEIKGIKGSISLSLENAEETQFYNVLLIDRDRSYDLGRVYTDDKGKGREELIFNIADLESKGFSVDRFNSILLKREDKILLGGYMDKEDGSIDRFIKQLVSESIKEKVVKEEKMQKEPEIIHENLVQEELVQENIIQENVLQEEIIQEEIIQEEVIQEEIIQEVLVEEEIIQEEIIEEEVMQEEIIQENLVQEELVEENVMKEDIIQEEVIQEEVIQEVLVYEEQVQEEIINEETLTEECKAEEVTNEIISLNDPIAEQILIEEIPSEIESLTQEVIAEDIIIPTNDLVSDYNGEGYETISVSPVSEECKVEDATNEIISLNDPMAEQLLVEEIPSKIVDPTQEVFVEDNNIIPTFDGGLIFVEEDYNPIFEPILELRQEPDYVAVEMPDSEFKSGNQPIFTETIDEVEVKDFDYEYNRKLIQKNQTTNYVLNILRYFPYIDPFRINLEGYNWWKIDFEDEAKGFLPYFNYVVDGDNRSRKVENIFTARDLMNLYNHYLFGLYNIGDEVKYYVYAIPGGFYRDEHPYGGITGFNTWFAGNEIPGYWLMYIDPLTGKVIFPINQMNPIE